MAEIKTTGSYEGKSNKLGKGGRFAQLKSKLSGKVSNPGAVAASIGRKKYGATKMAKMAGASKSHHMKMAQHHAKMADEHLKMSHKMA